MKKSHTISATISVLAFISHFQYAVAQETLPSFEEFRLPGRMSMEFTFSEPAKGGTLHLVHKSHSAHASVSITTRPNQPVEEVRAAFKEGLLAFPLENFLVTVATETVPTYVADWAAHPMLYLEGMPSEVILGGTETGLGILPPVGSLSAGFDMETRQHTIRWHEKSDYGKVYVAGGPYGAGTPARETRNILDGTPFRTLPADLPPNGRQYRYIRVVGFTNGLPTNASYLYTNKIDQIEYFFYPFTNGIASNWTGWTPGGAAPVLFEEKIYPDMERVTSVRAMRLERRDLVVSRCAQLLHSEKANTRGGMYRFFIAQTPGRVYRTTLRSHIMAEAAGFDGEWAFEIMTGVIAPDVAYEMDYATSILEGDYWQELGSRGSQISTWRYDHTMKPTDKWVMNQTGAEESDVSQKDIVLGKEKTAIFFCVRLSGQKPNGVAMDGVRVTDVTEALINPQRWDIEL